MPDERADKEIGSCPYEMVVNVGTVMFGVRETEPAMNRNRTHEAGWYNAGHHFSTSTARRNLPPK